jgi:uncharacterized protein YuzE
MARCFLKGDAIRIEFDQLADALYVNFVEGEVERTEEIKPGMFLDYDADGNVLGVEVLRVSKRADLPLKKAA